MPKYVLKQLTCYAHPTPLKPQHCPYSPNPILYGKNNQTPTPTDNSPALNDAGMKRIQQIVGRFLYYAWAVNPTILMALSDIATQQAAPTENTKKRVEQFLTCGLIPTPRFDTAHQQNGSHHFPHYSTTLSKSTQLQSSLPAQKSPSHVAISPSHST
jgi:hypothetical protein